MATAQTLTRPIFDENHAVELARAAHLDYTARFVAFGSNRVIFEVPSRDRSHSYTVLHTITAVDGGRSAGWHCECTHGQMRGGACCHIGAGVHAERCRELACSAA